MKFLLPPSSVFFFFFFIIKLPRNQMTIFSRKQFLLFSLILSNIFPLAVTQPSTIYICLKNGGNYTSNSTYGKNLYNLLSSIPSNTYKHGFYNNFTGNNSDRVYANALCRGDIQLDTCRSCINENANFLVSELCPGYKEAVTWPDKCSLRYSSKNMTGVMTDNPKEAACRIDDVQGGFQFYRAFISLIESLRDKASSGGSHLKFALGDAPGPDNLTIYGLVQCTPDLSEVQCKDCLQGLIGYIGESCNTNMGAKIVNPSCNLRYETYTFFDETEVVVDAPSPDTASNQIPPPPDIGRDVRKRNIIIIIVTLSVFLALMLVSYYVYCKGKGVTEKGKRENQEIHLFQLAGRSSGDQYQGGNMLGEECTDSHDFPSIKFDIICSATNQFSNENKLGQGGFGPVYKGILPDGKAIAVKRLSKTSGQGLQEFRNEISLIARLQHRNLVRLVGCCLEGNELLLIYEYMPNKSLDFFLFDSNKGAELDWTRRINIIKGIARGTLYLHEDSRLRIIHRDLKASNVLLDQEMNPKISDFGLARIFGVNQDEANTNRVVGTYGYMAPEYAMEGLFSVKSDVFSFGVILLEIISGKKNSGFYVNEHGHNLLSFAWELWSEGRGLELLDPLTKESSVEDQEVLKCIHIGLLCVQDDPADRPTMSVVVVMLASDTVTLPQPTKPTFPVGRQVLRSSGSSSHAGVVSVNEITISILSPR